MGDTVRYEVDGAVATIALDHPDTRNALSDEVLDDLIEAFEIARDDEGVRCVVLTSTHEKVFSSGGNLAGFAADVPLQEAIRRLSALPAGNLGLRDRGQLKPGLVADVVLFDPKTIGDHSTFEKPRHYATGVSAVFVNGVQVLKDGEHTGATPGRFVRGPGYKPGQSGSAAGR